MRLTWAPERKGNWTRPLRKPAAAHRSDRFVFRFFPSVPPDECAYQPGAAFCWGINGHGELGDGTTGNRVVPTSVSGGHILHVISTGSSGFGGHTCGLRTDGAALCWGANSNGQLGDGATVDRLVPTSVHGWIALP